MTEQEAIEVLKEKYRIMSMCFDIEDCKRNNQAISKAISALEKIQRYRNMEGRLKKIYGDCPGLLDKVVEHLEKHEDITLPDPIFKARLLTDGEVDRWEAYKQLGTVEELREAMEKQRTS